MPDRSTPRRMVVAVDGFAASKAAVTWAATDAALRKLTITLLHVNSSPMASFLPAESRRYAAMPRRDREAQEILEEAAAIVADSAGGNASAVALRSWWASTALPTRSARSSWPSRRRSCEASRWSRCTQRVTSPSCPAPMSIDRPPVRLVQRHSGTSFRPGSGAIPVSRWRPSFEAWTFPSSSRGRPFEPRKCHGDVHS
jgi:hypothetical protein